MKIITKPIDQLASAEYNPRVALTPDDLEYQQIRRSIQTFGIVEPVVWNERTGNVVGGHQRITVLDDLGYADIPVVVVDVTPDEERALNIALNKIEGRWDEQKLAEVLTDINDAGHDPLSVGFTSNEVYELMATVESTFDPADYTGNDAEGEGETSRRAPAEKPDAPPRDYLFTMSFAVLDQERNAINRAIRIAKDRHGVASSPAALVHIARQFLERNP